MKKLTLMFLLIGTVTIIYGYGKEDTRQFEPKKQMELKMSGAELETAVFAGGCFWGIEGVFELLEGVDDVVSGYSGGSADMAFYKMVGTGQTGHAEAVEIVYDPSLISYDKLLEIFFLVAHNPTELNYQGPDVGTEYRSAVFYMNEDQKKKTENYIEKLEMEKVYGQPIVTQLEELNVFYPAENYHQNYLRLNPNQPYIVYWDIPKIEDLEARYPELIADK